MLTLFTKSILREYTAFFRTHNSSFRRANNSLSSEYIQVSKHTFSSFSPTYPPFKRTKGHYDTIKFQYHRRSLLIGRDFSGIGLFTPWIYTIILPIYSLTVLLKKEANANKISLTFPSSAFTPNNPDNIIQEFPRSFHDKQSDSSRVNMISIFVWLHIIQIHLTE